MSARVKKADLYPPLGGGPCRIVERILKLRGVSPTTRERMVDQVESDVSLDNPTASDIYKPMRERTTVSPILPYDITAHGQYRMDLRRVTLKDLNAAVGEYFSTLQALRRKSDASFQVELRKRLADGWVDSRGLFLKLKVNNGDPIVVTVYWMGGSDPKVPPGGCPHTAGYRPPFGDTAPKTFVGEKPSKGIDRPSGDTIDHPPGEGYKSDRSRSNPQPTDSKENLTNHLPGAAYNTPGPSSDTGASPKTDTPVRTPGTPGDQYGHPYKENVYPRRTGGNLYPSFDERQRDQKGDAKRDSKKQYRRNKSKVKSRANRRYKRVKNRYQFKRVKDLRQDPKYADKYHRLPSGGYRSQAERAKDDREKKASISRVVRAFYMEIFTKGWNMDPGDGPQDMGGPSNTSPTLKYPDDHADRKPLTVQNDVFEINDIPGTSKKPKTASSISDLLSKVGKDIVSASKPIRPVPKGREGTLHTFSVPGSDGDYDVTVDTTDGLKVACSCNFWRWQGPEYWAKTGGYLYGSPVGTATKPSKRDPHGLHRLCKHAVACLRLVKSNHAQL